LDTIKRATRAAANDSRACVTILISGYISHAANQDGEFGGRFDPHVPVKLTSDAKGRNKTASETRRVEENIVSLI
jgi:hypothetical protein